MALVAQAKQENAKRSNFNSVRLLFGTDIPKGIGVPLFWHIQNL